LCFFFQAEDGIRDFHVTGVQTCSSDLDVGGVEEAHRVLREEDQQPGHAAVAGGDRVVLRRTGDGGAGSGVVAGVASRRARKSTRLNSSHVKISYAVFCLKKKKNI